MSYILDSLKKAEQQRHKEDAVDLRLPNGPGQGGRRRPTRVIVALILLVLVIGGGTAFLLTGDESGQSPAVDSRVVRPGSNAGAGSVAAGSEQEAASPVPRVNKTSAAPGKPAAPEAVQAKPAPKSFTKPDNSREKLSGQAEVLSVDQLPPGLRQKAYRLHLSLHYFAADASRRLVRLDGHLLREGQSLPNGPRIVRIERDGAVLAWDGYRFRLPRP